MKKTRILTALAAMILSAACDKNDQPGYLSDPDAVRVEAVVGSLTRSNPLGTPEEQAVFNEGDRIAISNGADYVVYVLNNGSWAPDEASKYLRWESNSMTFKAFYPANNYNSFESGFLLNIQNEGESYVAINDYMTAEVTADKSQAGKLSLRMERRTARVVVKIGSFRDEFDRTNPVVSGVKVYTATNVPYVEPYSPAPFEMFDKDGVFYALVSPSEAKPDQTFLELTVEYGDDKLTKTLTVKGVPAMEAGKSYTYSILVGRAAVKVGSVSVKDWTTGEAIDDGLTESVPDWSGNSAPFKLTDGSGVLGNSESSPILIENAEQLAYLAEQVNGGNKYSGKYFKLVSNIYLKGYDWTPIGGDDAYFSGSFDGNGKTIYGMKVNATAKAGLFGNVESSSIKNVTIKAAVSVCAGSHAALLCSRAQETTISGCSVSGSVESSGNNVGGVVGYLIDSEMIGCTAKVTVKGKECVGGIVGREAAGKILNCSLTDGIVEGSGNSVGGVVGWLGYSTTSKSAAIEGCIVRGSVKGYWDVGGIIGLAGWLIDGLTVADCDVNADLTCSSYAGGLVGRFYASADPVYFSNCGFDGAINAINDDPSNVVLGVVVGIEDLGSVSDVKRTFTDCWYNIDKTGDLPVLGKADFDNVKEMYNSGITAKNLGK